MISNKQASISFLMKMVMVLALLAPVTAIGDERVRIVYWASGNSLGLGALLERGGFLEDEGLNPVFQTVADVNAPARAVVTGSADIAFSASATGTMNMASEGIPVRAFMASNVAEAIFIVRPDSEIENLSELSGKRFGVSRVGSAAYALSAGILEENYGITASEFTHLPGNDSQLLQFLATGEADVVAVRILSLSGIPSDSYRVVSTLDEEWRRLSGLDVPPVLGLSITVDNFARQHPEKLAAFVRASQAALQFGIENPDAVAKILVDAANMSEAAAATYASHWATIYRADLSEETINTLNAMAEMFGRTGLLERVVPEQLYLVEPYASTVTTTP